MKRFFTSGLVLLFVLGFVVRLYRFDGPVADWHSFRQSDTNAVSIIFAREGIDLLHPRYFDISNVQSGYENPKGYRMVEFPIYNAVQAGLFGTTGILTLEKWGRLISIFATLAGAWFVYLLTKKYANEVAGLFGAFFYLFLPFSIYYGRTILPDPSMAGSILAGTYFFDLWIEKGIKKKALRKRHLTPFVLSIFFTALAFLLKPYALFFTLPIVYLAWRKFGVSVLRKWQVWLFAILCLIPLVLWRKWIGNFPEGIPASSWLFNGDGIRFRPSFFRWIFYERIMRLILGYVGAIFGLVGGIRAIREIREKNGGFFLSFIISSFAYLIVIATGNVRHDYYQILIIPTVSIMAGLGAAYLVEHFKKNLFLQAQIYILVALTILLGWIQVKDYFNINDWGMVAAAEEANKILPINTTVIAPYDGSTTFLNLTKRRGWPVFEKPIEDLIKMGAEYLVIANPTLNDFKGFGMKYSHVAESNDYLILKLK